MKEIHSPFTITIANIEVVEKNRGKGLFKNLINFLKENHPEAMIEMECVINPRLRKHLIKSGFSPTASAQHFYLKPGEKYKI